MTQSKLPESIATTLRPLFEALGPDEAMNKLVVDRPGPKDLLVIVEQVIKSPVIGARSPLVAGLWLYVDQLDRSHRTSQKIDDATGSFWHGIMHRREGDFSNSHYWFRKTGDHPVIALVGQGYDPHDMIDQVEQAHAQSAAPAELVALQRREWAALFQWCAQNGE